MLTQKKKFKLPQISSVCINGIMVFVLLVVLVPMLNLVAKSFSDPARWPECRAGRSFPLVSP